VRTSGRTAAKRILIIEPMTSAVDLISVARQLGIGTVVASYDRDDRRLPNDIRGQIDNLVQVDPNDDAALISAIIRLHDKAPMSAVLPGIEFYVGTAARVAHALKLPGLPVGSVEALRNKAVMRDRVTAAGLRSPAYATGNSEAELMEAAVRIGFPAVLKPVASAGSIHVSKISCPESLLAAYRAMTADERPDDVGLQLDGSVLLEAYLDGPELSVEGFVRDGHVVVVSVTRKLLGPEPHFVEVGHIVEYDLPPTTRTAITRYVADVCRALDVTMGPFHCELRLVQGEPVLVEIGARLPGGQICTLVERVTGASLSHIMLAAYTGGAIDYPSSAAPTAICAGIYNFTAPQLNKVTRISGLDRLSEQSFIRDIEMYVGPGDEVPPYGDFRCRLGHVTFAADSYMEALAHVRAVEGTVHIA
jgi:biotin carboxylase